jgi:hypothetical protein
MISNDMNRRNAERGTNEFSAFAPELAAIDDMHLKFNVSVGMEGNIGFSFDLVSLGTSAVRRTLCTKY